MLEPFNHKPCLDLPPKINAVSGSIVDSAYKVHHSLGPGLLENVYELCLFHHLAQKGLKVERQVEFPIVFEGLQLDVGFRIDLLVEGKVIVEIKAVERTLPVHGAQLLTYLKLTGKELGLLINFNVGLLKDGLKRVALSSNKK